MKLQLELIGTVKPKISSFVTRTSRFCVGEIQVVKRRLQPETLFAPTRVLPTRGLLPDSPYLEVQYQALAQGAGKPKGIRRGKSRWFLPRCRIFW